MDGKLRRSELHIEQQVDLILSFSATPLGADRQRSAASMVRCDERLIGGKETSRLNDREGRRAEKGVDGPVRPGHDAIFDWAWASAAGHDGFYP
jgi:hypothetical protein